MNATANATFTAIVAALGHMEDAPTDAAANHYANAAEAAAADWAAQVGSDRATALAAAKRALAASY